MGNNGAASQPVSQNGGAEIGNNPQRIENQIRRPRVSIDMVEDDELGCSERITPKGVHQVSLGIMNKPFPSSRPEKNPSEKPSKEHDRNSLEFRVAEGGRSKTQTGSKTIIVMNQIGLQVEVEEKKEI